MIRMLVKFGKWLESRFPEKLTVTLAAWNKLSYRLDVAQEQVDILRGELNDLKASHAATIDRVSRVEAAAVHKGAVQELVKHVEEQKTALLSLTASLGWSNRGVKSDEIAAILNGEPLDNGQ